MDDITFVWYGWVFVIISVVCGDASPRNSVLRLIMIDMLNGIGSVFLFSSFRDFFLFCYTLFLPCFHHPFLPLFIAFFLTPPLPFPSLCIIKFITFFLGSLMETPINILHLYLFQEIIVIASDCAMDCVFLNCKKQFHWIMTDFLSFTNKTGEGRV